VVQMLWFPPHEPSFPPVENAAVSLNVSSLCLSGACLSKNIVPKSGSKKGVCFPHRPSARPPPPRSERQGQIP
jgi:hypothetical protein